MITFVSYGEIAGKTSNTIVQNFNDEQTELSVGEPQPVLIVEDITG